MFLYHSFDLCLTTEGTEAGGQGVNHLVKIPKNGRRAQRLSLSLLLKPVCYCKAQIIYLSGHPNESENKGNEK